MQEHTMIVGCWYFFSLLFFTATSPLAAAEQSKTQPTLYPHDVIEHGKIKAILEDQEISVVRENLYTYRDEQKRLLSDIFNVTYKTGTFPDPELKQIYDEAHKKYHQANG